MTAPEGPERAGLTNEDRYRVHRDRVDYSADTRIQVVMQVRGHSQTVEVVIPQNGTAQAIEAAKREAYRRADLWIRERLRETARPLDVLS